MTKLPEKSEIKTAINNYCKAKSISKNELSTQINVSASTLSNIENENWKNIDDRMWLKIWHRVGVAKSTSIFTTKDYTGIVNACECARDNYLMTGIIGDTGMGKTTALIQYSQRKNTFYIAYDKTMKPRQFFVSLLKEMGIAFDGNIHELVNKLADELNVLDSPLVIIDEAGKITHAVMIYLQTLKDKTHLSCGYVLAGMPYFKANLIKQANKQKEGYAEFLRRINVWHELEGLGHKEVRFICENNGVTDAYTVKGLIYNKRFGDLVNALLLTRLTNSN